MIDDLLDFKWREIQHDASLVYRIGKAYVAETKMQPCCETTLKHYFREKKRARNIATTEKKKMSSNYKLRPGQKIFIHSRGLHVNENNLTDELAQLALIENPRLVKFFDVIPQAIVSVDPPVEVPDISTIKKVKHGRKNK